MLLVFIGLLLIPQILSKDIANTSSPNTVQDDDTYYPYTDWSDTFDWKLFKAFASKYKNMLVSPISLKLVLALLYEGSGGLTEKEFQNVMQFPVQKQLVRENFNHIITALQPTERTEYILNLGTRIFLDSKIQPQQKFASKALHNYLTNIEPTNFSNPIEASRTINSWIDKLTNGRVTEIVKSEDLEDTIMMIANAIYFKGTWRHQFPKNNTKMGGFYVSPREMINIPFMTTTDNFFFFESSDLDAKILRLPYRGNNYALFIILPNSKGGLPQLIKKINLHVLKRQLYFLDQIPVEVSIPKFQFSFESKMSQVLKDFGLRQMFQNTASFPGIARGSTQLLRMLVVSDILQKTGIELDEEGSVVYSATNIQIGNKFGEVDTYFNADHPFMFFIEEQTRGSILFVGKVENPLQPNAVPLETRFGDDDTSSSTPNPASSSNSLNLQPQNAEMDAQTRRFNYFDLELLKEFSESSENVFISPASIKTTLALILEGAKGKCAQEIGHALRIDNIEQRETRELLTRLLFDLNDKTKNTVLEAANSVFVSNKFNILPEYQKKVASYYRALVRKLDFTNSKEAAKVINEWSRNATHGVINEIVGTSNLFADSSIVLANALYFKGKWKTAFDVKNTKVKCFKTLKNSCVNTPIMQVGDTFNYNFIVDLDAEAIELPYQDDKYAMLILLPAGENSIRVLARDMQHAKFNSILEELRPTDIFLEMPRFEIDYSADLVNYLKPLKIQEIFGANANLTGIINQDNVKINNIAHKTRIEVNEQGTKAAAATAAIVIPLMGSSAQKLVVDRPFIFFIYHKESRNIIFEGILLEPISKTARQYSMDHESNFFYV